MLKFFQELLQKFNEQKSYTHRLETYVASKHPTTAAEVDYWIREFDRKDSYYA